MGNKYMSRETPTEPMSPEQVATMELLNRALVDLGIMRDSNMDYFTGLYATVVSYLYDDKKIDAIKWLREWLETSMTRPTARMQNNLISDWCDRNNIFTIEWKQTIGLKEAKNIIDWIQANEISLK